MERKLSISELYSEMLALKKASINSDFLVTAKLDETDDFFVHVMDKRSGKACETLWFDSVKEVSKNLIDGFMLIAHAVGFMDGINKAREVEFGPLEKVEE